MQDLLKKYLQLQENIEDTRAIEEILVNGVEQLFEVLTSLRSWLTSAKCRAGEIKALEDQKREEKRQENIKNKSIIDKKGAGVQLQHLGNALFW